MNKETKGIINVMGKITRPLRLYKHKGNTNKQTNYGYYNYLLADNIKILNYYTNVTTLFAPKLKFKSFNH